MKVRKGGGEEIPFVQGKEQRLRFAGAAVKRYPTPKVRETQVKMVGVARGHQRAERSYSAFKVRRDDSSKAKSSGCALLEQP